jgi:hypothetical protein
MEANELRIGNWVKPIYDIWKINIEFQVDWVMNCNIGVNENVSLILYDTEEIPLIEIEPIPLTEDWLNKFGLNYDGMEWDKNDIGINLDANNYNAFFYDKTVLTPIKYVHQLQNLYFALTGEELTT